MNMYFCEYVEFLKSWKCSDKIKRCALHLVQLVPAEHAKALVHTLSLGTNAALSAVPHRLDDTRLI